MRSTTLLRIDSVFFQKLPQPPESTIQFIGLHPFASESAEVATLLLLAQTPIAVSQTVIPQGNKDTVVVVVVIAILRCAARHEPRIVIGILGLEIATERIDFSLAEMLIVMHEDEGHQLTLVEGGSDESKIHTFVFRAAEDGTVGVVVHQ